MAIINCNIISRHFICFVLSMSLINEAICERYFDNDRKCSANENKFFKVKKGRCKTCKPCQKVGTARNFSEEYTGNRSERHGDLDCLPCRPPPEGYYVDKVYIVLCRDCASLNRKTDQLCSPLTDASCGSCLPGFEDRYGTTELPCVLPEHTRPSTKTPYTENANIPAALTYIDQTGSNFTTMDLNVTAPNVDVLLVTKNATSKESFTIRLLAAVLLASMVLLFLIVFTMFLLKRYRGILHRKNKERVMTTICRHNDIETDATRDPSAEVSYNTTLPEQNPLLTHTSGRSGRRTYPTTATPGLFVNRPNERPHRANLVTSSRDIVRGEMGSFTRTTNRFPEIPPVNATDRENTTVGCDNNCPVCQQNPRLSSCHCRQTSRPDLHRDYTFADNVSLTNFEGIDLLGKVSNYTCHCPMPLFKDIGVPHPVFYRTSTDRQDNPERMSFKEFIRTNLKEWSRASPGKGATLQVLLKGLYKAKFYSIMDLILRLPEITILEETYAKDVVPDSE